MKVFRVDTLRGERRLSVVQRFPNNATRRYNAQLLAYVNRMFDLTKEILFTKLETIVTEANVFKPRTDKTDAFADKVSDSMTDIRTKLDVEYTDNRLEDMARSVGDEVSDFNRNEVVKLLSSSAGVQSGAAIVGSRFPSFLFEPWLDQEISGFVKRNVSLIKTVPTRYMADIENVVYRGIRNNKRHDEIQKEIRSRFPVSRNNARRIARDQVNKINGELTQLRHQQVGVKKYRWITVGDERVRSAHTSRNGKVFFWNDPPSDGHPGEPIQCRCYAEPILI